MNDAVGCRLTAIAATTVLLMTPPKKMGIDEYSPLARVADIAGGTSDRPARIQRVSPDKEAAILRKLIRRLLLGGADCGQAHLRRPHICRTSVKKGICEQSVSDQSDHYCTDSLLTALRVLTERIPNLKVRYEPTAFSFVSLARIHLRNAS